MTFLLALDQGTTSSRALVFDEEGGVRAQAQRELTQHFPRPGWVEHDPLEIWSSEVAVVEEALSTAGLRTADLAGLGITNQRETVVVWDRATGTPIHRAIVWQDRRTADACRRLGATGAGDLVRERTGLRLDPYFSAAKIAWILDHVSGARARAARGELAFGTIDSWLLWNLTGGRVHATDVTNASRTSLFDIRRGAWDADLLDAFDVPSELLPEVRSSSEVYGEARGAAAGVAIAGVAGDQQAALFGQACFERGLAKNTYGTGCFLLANTEHEAVASRHGLVTTVAWRIGDRAEYALEGSVFAGGAVVQWLRDGLGLISSAPEIEPLARSVPDSAGVYVVPAFTGLGAPWWDPHARGTIVGLTRGTTRAHLARAALEAVAYQVADVADAMRADAGFDLTELRADGGAARNDLLLQLQADLLGCAVVRFRRTESTAWGAAGLAGRAIGVWKDRREIAARGEIDRRFEPRLPSAEAAARRRVWARAVERARGWAEPV